MKKEAGKYELTEMHIPSDEQLKDYAEYLQDTVHDAVDDNFGGPDYFTLDDIGKPVNHNK